VGSHGGNGCSFIRPSQIVRGLLPRKLQAYGHFHSTPSAEQRLAPAAEVDGSRPDVALDLLISAR